MLRCGKKDGLGKMPLISYIVRLVETGEERQYVLVDSYALALRSDRQFGPCRVTKSCAARPVAECAFVQASLAFKHFIHSMLMNEEAYNAERSIEQQLFQETRLQSDKPLRIFKGMSF